MAGLKDLDPALIRQLLETFRAQMEERLQAITDGLLALERQPEAAERTALLEAMFRAAHNIKGAARGIGLDASAELAHAVEDMFAAWKRGELAMTSASVDLCLGALDALRGLVDAEALGRPVDAGGSALLEALRAAAQGVAPAVQPPRPAPQPVPAAPAAAGDSVRLPVARLDRIADLAEDIRIAKIRLDDHRVGSRRVLDQATRLRKLLERVVAHSPAPAAVAGLATGADLLADALDLALELERRAGAEATAVRATVGLLQPAAAALREDARALRMVPAASILMPMARSVRDLAHELGKEAELVLSGEQTEMDRAILEALRDPLMHLLRNAIDHGIEPPTVRRARGKPETGRIAVSLAREGGSVHITVADDGAGIDAEALRRQVLKQGLATPAELDEMAPAALFDFLFRPGFSTRETVGAVSGRGVGLDVVRVNLQALHGRVALDSGAGEGTRFHLDLPLTLAGEHGLVLSVGGQRFAIPNQYVVRLLELQPDEIAELGASQVVHLGKEPVPLRDLATLLRLGETPPPPQGEPIRIIVVSRGWQRVALRVDEVQGEREMVIKPLAPPLDGIRFFAGGTPGRDGNIVLVLEAAALIAAALASGTAGVAVRSAGAQEAAPRILVVDDSITTRTLEESILVSAGYRVATAADGADAWDRLRQENFDLVISDVEMPGLDGFELTRRIRQDARLGRMPVIIVTSLGSEDDRRRGMDVNADAYIVKSNFESRELLETVEQLL